jgi:hypothetical protein
VRETNWKAIFITLLCSAAIALACCAPGSPTRDSVGLLIVGAIATMVFVLQVFVAIVRFVIEMGK